MFQVNHLIREVRDIGSQIFKIWHIFIYASIPLPSGFENHCIVGG